MSRPPKRKIDGILLLDKSLLLSSNQALQKVKYLYAAEKAGHSGSLDPLATGMLPIFFGEAPKFSQFALNANKTYEAIAKLGIRTDTADAEGKIIEQHEVPVLNAERIELFLKHFRGEITQIPPIYSALKYQGKPAYEYARRGEHIKLAARTQYIYQLELINFSADEISLRVQCDKGTYIRTLIDDLGQLIGCGAYVKQLRRTAVAGYEQFSMVTFEKLSQIAEQQPGNYTELDEYLLPIDAGLQHLPQCNLTPEQAQCFLKGQQIAYKFLNAECDYYENHNHANSQPVRCYANHQFIGIAEYLKAGLLQPRRLIKI